MKNVRITKLENGFTVVSDFNPSIETVFCGVWASVGSRNETKEINGISHFLEHMAFKGTTTKTYKDIAEIIEDIGGDINAYTSKDHTFFYTKTLKEYLEVSIDILADIIQNSVFDENETSKERNVILQEYYSSLDTPDDVIYDYYGEVAYPNQPLGRAILGTDETIRSITPDMLKSYIKTNYCADKLFLVVSGNFDEEKVIELAKKYFTNLTVAGCPPTPPAKYEGGYFIKNKDLEQVHLMLGFEATNLFDRKEVFCENILCNTLGGGMSSRLFQEVREKHNLVYTIYSSVSNYSDTGHFYIYTSTVPEKINKVIDATAGEILKICDGITEREFERAKISYKSSVLMSLENSTARARVLGRQMQHFGKHIPFSESIQLIESLSLDDIKNTAQKIFSSKITVAGLGKCEGIYDLDTIKLKLSK
ncbi:MAG: insulinase family protein [bacterium]|nr:insulinase family protein [bacterium]